MSGFVQCAFHVSCQRSAEYGIVNRAAPVTSITKLYCLHHIDLFLADLEPGDSRVVYRALAGGGVKPERELHMVTS